MSVLRQVYKTSILVFKDRDKYVTGEFRYAHYICDFAVFFSDF